MRQKGQILLLTFISLGVALFTVLFIIGGAQIYFQNAQYSLRSEKATALAEAGFDKALASLNKTGGSYSGETETSLGEGSYSVTITSQDLATKIIEATGYVPSKDRAQAKRTIKVVAARGVGIAFNYGIQVGEGGLELGNSNVIQGSIYSNGSITAGNDNSLSGNVFVAGGAQNNPDQQTNCEGVNCADFLFGKIGVGDVAVDVAQSFKPASSGVLNKVSIKLKKVGTPSDLTVRILGDASGVPDKNNVLTSGTLYANLVTASYGWIDVTFTAPVTLSAETTYWLMIDAQAASAHFWSWQNDLAQSYTRGKPMWSPNWSADPPLWNDLVGGGDLSFKLYLGGLVTSIRAGTNKMTIGGDAHANTIENLIINKNAYYQTIITSTVKGTSYPGSADPLPKSFPISEGNIADWKQQAQEGGVLTGDINGCVTTLEAKKYVGNVSFGSGCSIVVKSPVWITGNLTLNSNNTLTLDSSYGATSGVIIVDGKVDFNSNNHLYGTGVGNSLLMILSTYDSRTNGETAIKVNSNGNSGVYYADKGIIEPGTGNTFAELTAWKIRLLNNSTINYSSGLESVIFLSGPSGSYSLVKGTYQAK